MPRCCAGMPPPDATTAVRATSLPSCSPTICRRCTRTATCTSCWPSRLLIAAVRTKAPLPTSRRWSRPRRRLPPGIGYIRFTAFFGTPEEVAQVNKWLAENRDAKTLIFDLRNHHGGGLDEQDAIFSYIFAKRTPLVKMALSKTVFEQR